EFLYERHRVENAEVAEACGERDRTNRHARVYARANDLVCGGGRIERFLRRRLVVKQVRLLAEAQREREHRRAPIPLFEPEPVLETSIEAAPAHWDRGPVGQFLLRSEAQHEITEE